MRSTSENGKPPEPLPVLFAEIPGELRALPRWVVWSYTWNGKRWDKPPLAAATLQRASVTNPATWTTFEHAQKVCTTRQLSGLGLVLQAPADDAPGLVALDLDKCRDPHTGELQAWAQAIVDSMDTYTEISPSGCGLRIFAYGHLPAGRNRKGPFEIYNDKRYVTLTGQRLEGKPGTLATCQEQIDRWCQHFFSDPPKCRFQAPAPELDDGRLLEKARRASNGGKFTRLFDHGDTSGYGSASEADAALCCLLAFYTQDAARIERLFNQSSLAQRGKWRDRPDYRARTIAHALATVSARYDPAITPAGRGERSTPLDSRPPELQPPAEPKTGYQIILDFFRAYYEPIYREGTALYSHSRGRLVKASEATYAPGIVLAELLAKAADAPSYKGVVQREKLHGFFWTWARTVWVDLLDTLPVEEESPEVAELAAEEFGRKVAAALFSLVTLGHGHEDGETVAERRSLLDWANLFAKPAGWASIRSYQLWCRRDPTTNEVRLALRVGLFGQLRASSELARLSPKKFAELCERYGLGQAGGKAQGQRVVELAPDFVRQLATPKEALPDH